MAAWSAWVFAVLALGSLAGGQLPMPAASGPTSDLAGGDSPGPAAAPDQSGSSAIAMLLKRIEEATGQHPADPFASPGLLALGMRQVGPPGAPTNTTNQTVIPGYGNGTNTHYHGNVGDQGLGAVWASVFHGVPDVATAVDLDGDGTPDTVLGTDLSVTALSGRTGQLMWARHLGSSVTSVFAFENDGQAGIEVGYSTLWEGQTPRVGVLDGRTGAVRWEHIGERPYLLAAPAQADGEGPSDVLAVDTDGTHTRLDAATGDPVWAFDVDLLPDDATGGVAPSTVYANLGQYLAQAADLNGDGTTDTVSVGLYHYAAGLNQYSLIQAVDGRTGQRLWVTNVGGDPHVIADGVVFDIEALDTQGDGSFDLAYSFLVFRYDALTTLLFTWEQGWRVTKGDSSVVGVPIASRTLATPVVVAEQFPDLDHTDVDGDGRHELAVLHAFAANPTLGFDYVTYERYAMPLGSTGDPTLLAVSDVVVSAGTGGRIVAFDLDADGANDHGVSRVLEDGTVTWTVATDDGQVLGPFAVTSAVHAAAGLGDKVAVALRGALELRPVADLNVVASTFFLRGAPRAMRLADLDQDGTQDIYVLASDDAVHVVDGVTGIVASTLRLGAPANVAETILDFQVADLGRGLEPDILLLRGQPGTFSRAYLEGRDGGSGKVLFSGGDQFPPTYYRLPTPDAVWFDGDGDGVRDVLIDWDWTELTALDGFNGKTLWTMPQATGDTTVTGWDHAAIVNVDGGLGQDIVLSARQGILVVDGERGSGLGWHPVTTNGSFAMHSVSCTGGADGDGDGRQTVFAIHDGSAGDLARSLTGNDWAVLDWVPDESQVARCDLRAVANGDGTEDLLVSMVWVQGDGAVYARVGRWDVGDSAWVWEDLQRRPDVEAEAYFAFGVSGAGKEKGRVFLAWQDHAYSLAWGNGSLIGEFTVNGPFVLDGAALDLDGTAPAEAIVLAADGIVWAVGEDRGLVAQRLAQKAEDHGKDSNYGAGSSFEAPPAPPEKKAKKSLIPGPPLALLAAGLLGAALRRAQRGNR